MSRPGQLATALDLEQGAQFLAELPASRFRITTFPDLPSAPPEVAVPRLVGILSAREVLPALPEGFVALPPDWIKLHHAADAKMQVGLEVFFAERVADQAINGPGSYDFTEQLKGFVDEINRYRRWQGTRYWPDWTTALVFDPDDFECSPLPDELFLREFLGVDTTDGRSVSRFVREWGPLIRPIDDAPELWADSEQFARKSRPPGDDYVEHDRIYSGDKVIEDRGIHHRTHWEYVASVNSRRQFGLGSIASRLVRARRIAL
jgi:hypothetical protein